MLVSSRPASLAACCVWIAKVWCDRRHCGRQQPEMRAGDRDILGSRPQAQLSSQHGPIRSPNHPCYAVTASRTERAAVSPVATPPGLARSHVQPVLAHVRNRTEARSGGAHPQCANIPPWTTAMVCVPGSESAPGTAVIHPRFGHNGVSAGPAHGLDRISDASNRRKGQISAGAPVEILLDVLFGGRWDARKRLDTSPLGDRLARIDI